MKAADVAKTAFSMPLTSPAYPPGPYRFIDREFFVVTYRTDPEALRQLVPDIADHDVFLCGAAAWMEAAAAAARECGVPAQHIHLERFSW